MKLQFPQLLFIHLFIFISFSSFSQYEPQLAIIEVRNAEKNFSESNTLFNNGVYDESLEKGLLTLKNIEDAEKWVVDSPFKMVDNTTDLLRAHATNSLGIIYQSLDDTYNAEHYLDEASHLYRKLGSHRELAFNQASLAMVSLQEEDFKNALIRFKRSKMIFGNLLKKKPNTLDSFFLYAPIQFSIGYVDAINAKDTLEKNKASQKMESAISFFYKNSELIVERDKAKYKFPAIILRATKLELEKNVFEDKDFLLDYLDKAIAIYENSRYKNHPDLGKMYGLKALMLLRHKKDLEQIKDCTAQAWRFLCQDENRNTIRKKIERKTLGIKETGDILFAVSNRANTNFEMYKNFNQSDKLTASYQDALLSIELMDELIRHFSDDSNLETILNRYASLYQFATTVTYAYYKKTNSPSVLNDLFFISEKQKSYVLRKAVNRQSLLTDIEASKRDFLLKGDSLLKKLRAIDYTYYSIKEGKITDEVTKIRNKKRQAQVDHYNWLEQLEKNEPKIYNLLYDNKVISKEKIKNKITKDQIALVEYIITQDQIFTLLITPTLDTVFVKDRTKETEKKLRQYYKSLAANYESDNYRETAFDAYQILFKEVDEVLSKQHIQQVYLVLDGILHTISFNAMLTKSDDGSWYDALPYLLFDYEFSRHFSATSILQNSRKAKIDNEISFGGFVADYDFFPKGEGSCDNIISLRGTASSSEMIKDNFQKGKLFKKATLVDFENEFNKYNILHLSLHGCLDYEKPNFSSLVFTFENAHTPYELKLGLLYNKTITAELVVLSACDTGGGKYRKGQGLISFNRAFFYAGCKSVVSSLWEANNEAAQVITNSFYDNLVQGKMKKDKALTEALRQYVQSEVEHPSTWANFIIMGNMNQLN